MVCCVVCFVSGHRRRQQVRFHRWSGTKMRSPRADAIFRKSGDGQSRRGNKILPCLSLSAASCGCWGPSRGGGLARSRTLAGPPRDQRILLLTRLARSQQLKSACSPRLLTSSSWLKTAAFTNRENLKQRTTLLPTFLARSACSTCTTPDFAQQMRHVAVHKFFPFLSVLLFR